MKSLRNVFGIALLGTTLAFGSTGCSVKFNKKLLSAAADLGIKGGTSPSGTPTVPTKLAVTGSTADLANACSTIYTVTSEGSGNTPVSVLANTIVTLTGNGGGTFYSDAACTQVITSVTIPSGDSTATFYFKDATFQSLTFTAATTGLTTGTLPVTVVANLPDAAHSTIAVGPASLTANGTSTSTVTITLLDSSGNPVVGVVPQFASTGTGNTLVQAVTATNSSGVATGTIASTKAEVKILDISSPTGLAADTTTVTFVPGPASLSHSIVSVSAATINSGNTSTLTLTAKDANDNSLASGGLTVAFTFSGGGSAGTIGSVTDHGDGTYTAVLTGTASGSASTVHATIGGSAVTSSLPTVTVNPGSVSLAQSIVSVSAATIASGGTSTLTLTAKDVAGNQLSSGGLTVAFTFSGGGSAGTIGSVTDNNNGTYTATLTGTTSGTASTVHATIGGSAVTSSLPTVTVNPGSVSLAQSIVTVSAGTINSGGTSTLTLTAKDAAGNLLTSGGLTAAFTFSGGGSAGTIGSVTDNNNGTYTATLTGTTSGTASTVHATIGGSAVTSSLPTVTVNPGGVSLAQSIVSVSAAAISSSGTSTLTLTAKDTAGNQLTAGGLTVAFTFSGGGSAGTIGSVTDNGNGTYTATLTGTTSGTASTVHATIGGSAVTSSLPTVTVNPGTVSLAQSIVSVSAGTINSGGTSTLTLTAKDTVGNQLTSGGLTVAFTFSGGGSAGTIGSVTDNSNGTYTATLTGTTSGTASTVHATIGGSAVTSSLPTVTVNPGSVSLAQSIVSVSAATIASGGTSTLTLTAKDAAGNQLTSGGLTVAFTYSGGGSAGTIGSVTDNSNGTYTATLTGTTSGTASTVSATIGGSAVTSSLPTVTVNPGSVSLAQSIVSVSAAAIASGGTSTLTLTAKDAAGNQLTSGGLTVAFTYSGGGSAGTIGSVTDNSNGTYTATLTGTTSGTASTVSATIGGSAVTSSLPTVTVNPGAMSLAQSLVSVSAATIASGGTSTLTLTAKDAAGNQLTGGGLTVAFTFSGGVSAGTIGSVTDNSNGTYTATLTGTTSGTASTVHATIGGSAVTSSLPTVTVNPGSISLAQSIVTVSAATINSGGTSTLTLISKDAAGNLLTTGGQTVAFTFSGGVSDGTIGAITDHSDGTYTATLTGTTAGTASTVHATIGGSAVTSSLPTVTVNPGSVSLAQSIVSVSAGTITSGNTSTLTLTAKDAAGNQLAAGGLTVAFTFSGGGSAGTIGSVTDNSNGTYTATLTGTTSGTASTVHATIGGSAVTSSLPTVTVNVGALSLAQSTVSVSAGTINSGGTSTLTLTAKDAAGNQLTSGGLTVAFTFSGGGSAGTIGSVTDNSNGTYTATLTGTTSGTASTVHATIGGSAVTSSLPTVTVNPGTATKLAFTTQPGGSVSACATFTTQPVVVIQDAAGNTVTGSSATVALGAFTLSNCTSSATGTLNSGSVAASSGVVTYTAANFSQGATIYLQATSAGLTSACSTGTVTVAAPTKTITISSGGTQTGSPYASLGTSLGVSVTDTCGLAIANEPVTWTLSNSSAGFVSTSSSNSDSTGKVYGGWYMSTIPGAYTVQASIASGPSVTFNGTSAQGAWTAIATTNAPTARYGASAIWTGSKMVVWGGYSGSYLNDGGIFDPVANSWTAGGTASTNAPSIRSNHTAVWTGAKMIVWGGYDGTSYLSDGGLFDPIANSWAAGGTNATGAPAGRNLHTAIWTGNQMIVWGGADAASAKNSGASYDPSGSGTWTALSSTNAPTIRFGHTAVWTGRRMIIWGGLSAGAGRNDGGIYDTVAGAWSVGGTNTTNAPSGRGYHVAVWTGAKMIVWGGFDGSTSVGDGGVYDASGDSWTSLSSGATNEPSDRYLAAGFWTGSSMLVWGGLQTSGATYLGDMGFYDPVANKWGYVPGGQTGEPTGRDRVSAVWTGNYLLVWGGNRGGTAQSDGGIYDPQPVSTLAWKAMSATSAPTVRDEFGSVWTGSKLVVWGGENYSHTKTNTGGVYDPIANSWTATTTTSAPIARYMPTSVWTGSKAIFWGGYTTTYANTGGMYDPVGDTWTATSTTSAPAARWMHSAIWTGSKMVVFGGHSGGSAINTGGIFDPTNGANGAWTAMSTTNAPTGRCEHAAVWTGSKMIVWGGNDDTGTNTWNTGAAFDPGTNAWTAGGISTSGAPTARTFPAAVWTGSKMIIWGGCPSSSGNGPGCSVAAATDGALYDPGSDTWTAMSSTNSPGAMGNMMFTWTGSLLLVWGGDDGAGNTYTNVGGTYNPSNDTWTQLGATNEVNSLAVRYAGTMVWTGARALIWGGYGLTSDFNDGAIVDTAAANPWKAMSTTNMPSARSAHSTVWTGSKMIVWGGWNGTAAMGDGGIYDPVADTWTAIASGSANEPTARYSHMAVWTGSKMIVVGGYDGTSTLATGASFDPETGSWASIANITAARDSSTAVWTGTWMVVWGGSNGGGAQNSGYAYNPSANTWTALSTTTQPVARFNHTAVWTGSKMIVWGGSTGGTPFTTGGVLDLSAGLPGTWTATTATGVPTKRASHAAVWTGSNMIVFGGYSGTAPLNSGSSYDPVGNTWTALPAVPTESGSAMNNWGYAPQAVWTGSRMIVWGGDNLGFANNGLSRGIMYNPFNSTWAKTGYGYTNYPVDGSGGGRQGHSLVWTGTQLIVWGGCTAGTAPDYHCTAATNNGAIFTPFYTP